MRAKRAGVGLFLASIAWTGSAWAHDTSLSHLDGRIVDSRIELRFRLDGESILETLNAGDDSALELTQLNDERGETLERFNQRFSLSADGVSCAPNSEPRELYFRPEIGRVYLSLDYVCPAPPSKLALDSRLFAGAPGHRLLVTLQRGSRRGRFMLPGDQPRLEIEAENLQDTKPVTSAARVANPPLDPTPIAKPLRYRKQSSDTYLWIAIGLFLVGGFSWILMRQRM